MSRNAISNNINTDPSKFAVLTDSVISPPHDILNNDFGFQNFLLYPIYKGSYSSHSDIVNSKPVVALSFPNLNNVHETSRPSFKEMSNWCSIAFAHVVFCRRDTTVALLPVKPRTNVEMLIELTSTGESKHTSVSSGNVGVIVHKPIVTDVGGRRNPNFIVPFTETKIHAFKLPTMYYRAKKVSTLSTSSLDTQTLVSGDECDGTLALYQRNNIQQGLFFPSIFNTHVLISYVGSQLNTITSPVVGNFALPSKISTTDLQYRPVLGIETTFSL